MAAVIAVAFVSCREQANSISTDSRSHYPPSSQEVETAALAKGNAIAVQAFGLLSSNLLQAVNQYGVSNALPYCSAQAIPLTALVAKTNGVVVRRVSHKVRNPANRATDAEVGLIQKWQGELKSGGVVQPSVVEEKNA